MRRKIVNIKKIVTISMASCLLLSQTGCGSTSGSTEKGSADYAAESYSDYNGDSYEEDYAEDASESLGLGEETGTVKVSNKKSSNLNLDMLVYRCNVMIDTLNYEESYHGLLDLISEYGGFVESSEYSDNGSNYSYYYIESSDKHLQCSITARIPSDKYEEFTSKFGNLGDVRSLSANVENLTQEYTDSDTALKIYREQEKRYIAMIADADPSYAMELQSELTELEIKIAKLESRMQNIRNDVAYSYVEVNLREVKKYSLHDQTDTFSMRMKDNLSDSWSSFLNFLESVLTFFIYAWYYIVLLILIIIAGHKLHRAWRNKHPKKVAKNKRYESIYKTREIMPEDKKNDDIVKDVDKNVNDEINENNDKNDKNER